PDLLQDRHDDRLERRRTVLLVHGPEHALAAGLIDEIAQDAVVDVLPCDQAVIGGLRDLANSRVGSGFDKEHERRVPKVHGRSLRFADSPGLVDQGTLAVTAVRYAVTSPPLA